MFYNTLLIDKWHFVTKIVVCSERLFICFSMITVIYIQGESKKSDDCDMYNRNVIPCGV